jgi:hypothetical protein
MKSVIADPVVEGHSSEDFAASTQRVRDARSALLRDPRAAAAPAALGDQIAGRTTAT